MANLFGLELGWEAIQTTILPYLLGRFKARANTPPPTTGGGTPEAPLQQQTTSVLKPRNDEAIQFAVDATLRKMRGGEEHVRNIQAVREALEPHQQSDWRENLGTLTLTERFEHVMASETITRGNAGGQQNQAAAGQPPRGQERIERKFERRPIDYEYTENDPRVQHLVLVSKVVSGERTVKRGVVKAKAYLLSAGLIAKQSPTQRAAATAEQGKESAVNAIRRHVSGVPANDPVLMRLESAVRNAATADAKRQAEVALGTFLSYRSTLANTERAAKERVARLRMRIFIGIVVVVVLAMATYASTR